MKTNKQIFEKASRIVRERGLSKWVYGSKGHEVCLLGAVSEVVCGDPRDTCKGHDLVTFPEAKSDLIAFNDHPSTTADEVADVLWLLGQIA
jgi:hypothetical protein